MAGPLNQATGILYAEIKSGAVALYKRPFDVAGHYSRPDVFTLHVNIGEQSPVMFEDK